MSEKHASTLARIRAVTSSPTLYRLAAALEYERLVGRNPTNPLYVVLAYGVLARVLRSGIRVQVDLQDHATWTMIRAQLEHGLAASGVDAPPPGLRPPAWGHWRWLRDRRLTTDAGLDLLEGIFPTLAVETAHRIGVLLPSGPGSLTHPDPSRCAYGDGTLVRPMYRPPDAVSVTEADGSTHLAYPHPRTKELLEQPPGRFDPDLQMHHGQLGPVQTHGYVCWHARGPQLYQRVVLAAAHIPAPGAEAATAIRLLGRVRAAAGDGIQAVIYDGAMNGVHIDEVMTRYGYLLVAKQPTSSTDADISSATLVLNDAGRRTRSYPLGTVRHTPAGWPPADGDGTAGGGNPATAPRSADCVHQLATIGGRVVEVGLDETGDPVVQAEVTRGPVKRFRRTNGTYHFNVGYQVPCPREPFTVWLSPHAHATGDPRRPQNLRVIPETDPDAERVYGLRNDAESFHSNLKRTLICDRAMSLGWRRGLIDVYCFSLLNNALTEARAAADESNLQGRTTRRRRSAASDRQTHSQQSTGAALQADTAAVEP